MVLTGLCGVVGANSRVRVRKFLFDCLIVVEIRKFLFDCLIVVEKWR